MFKKILLGIGVMLLALMALGASDCGEVETDTPDSPAVTATEAPAVEPEPAVVDDECYLTASCPLQNGWTEGEWVGFVTGLVEKFGQSTPEAVALAACVADVYMLRLTPPEALAISVDEGRAMYGDIITNECFSLVEAALDSQ